MEIKNKLRHQTGSWNKSFPLFPLCFTRSFPIISFFYGSENNCFSVRQLGWISFPSLSIFLPSLF